MEIDPDDPQPETRRETVLTLILTAVFGGGFLIFLILVSGGFFFYVVVGTAVIAGFGLLHWLLWGRSMTQDVAQERAEEERKEQQEYDTFLRDKLRSRRL
jgi:fatty acid desaturase